MEVYFYTYMQTEIGPKYLIPLHRIMKLKFEENDIGLHFTDGENNDDTEMLRNVDKKGIAILEEAMKNKLQAKS